MFIIKTLHLFGPSDILVCMLAGRYKLNSVEFKKTFEQGKTIHTTLCICKYMADQESTKCAVVVSKKHTKTAIGRNYQRRRIYNILKHIQETRGLPPQSHIIFILKKHSHKPSIQELTESIQMGLDKI